MREWRQAAVAIGGALVVGTALGFLRGNGDPLRSALGNLSAPWLLIALLPAWWAGSAVRGALLGTATTLAGLLGFYAAVTVVLHGHLGGASGWPGEYRYIVAANRVWFAAGLLSGPVAGAIGGLVGRAARRGARWLAMACGLVMITEFPVAEMASRFRLPAPGLAWAAEGAPAYAAEALVGVMLVSAALVGRSGPSAVDRGPSSVLSERAST